MAKITRRRKKVVKSDNMDNTAKYERMAEIKMIIKSLDDEYKTIQTELLESGLVAEKVKTEYGTLSLRTRENWKVVDNNIVIDHMGQEDYNKYSTISKTGIIKAIGEQGFSDLKVENAVSLTSVSQFYQLGK